MDNRIIYNVCYKNVWGFSRRQIFFMKIINLEEMTRAIEYKIGMKKNKARKIASFILDAFGYESRIIDNILKPDERQLFYILQSEGFLTTARERTRLHDGREWMTHYWTLQRETIYDCACKSLGNKNKSMVKKTVKKQKKDNIYNNLSDEVWLTRKILHRDPLHHI